MDPELAKAWVRVIRDIVIYTLATVIVSISLVLYITRQEQPSITWLSFAAFLFGLVPALRADEWLLRKDAKDARGEDR